MFGNKNIFECVCVGHFIRFVQQTSKHDWNKDFRPTLIEDRERRFSRGKKKKNACANRTI